MRHCTERRQPIHHLLSMRPVADPDQGFYQPKLLIVCGLKGELKAWMSTKHITFQLVVTDCNKLLPKSWSIIFFFITSRKRSFGQGNIFIGVCQEFCSHGGVGGGGCLLPGVPGPGGCLLPEGAWWRPPGRLLLRVVRILLECILIFVYFLSHIYYLQELCK